VPGLVHRPVAVEPLRDRERLAVLEAAPRNSTITALTAVDVLTIGRGVFQTLLATFPALRTVFEDLAHARRVDR